ncbi:MAG: hypothetical protein Tsb0026_06980 [Sulfuricaulis sp.]
MKCYTITKNGVAPGIQFLHKPYPHVVVGDPTLSSADCRRVEVDAALANSTADDTIMTCSYIIEMKNSENRRSSYKLVAATGDDDDRILVKIEVRSVASGQRTFYDLPLNTLALANGWYLAGGKGPQAETPVNLVVLKKGDEIKIRRMVDMHKPAEFVFSASFNGSELRQNPQRAAA